MSISQCRACAENHHSDLLAAGCTLQQVNNLCEASAAPGPSPAYAHAWCALDLPLDQFYDYQLANHTITAMQTASALKRPWFIAAGFRRPHVPWRIPLSFWEAYAPEKLHTPILPPKHPLPPKLMPEVAFTCGDQCSFELGNIKGHAYNGTSFGYGIDTPLDPDVQVLLRRAYYASTSFMDSQVSLVLVCETHPLRAQSFRFLSCVTLL
jgi:iduronate 2-sulfatase